MKSCDYPWFRKRGYLHFDRPISVEHALDIVTNPNTVATHSFLPIINFTSTTFKIHKDKSTNAIIKTPKDRPIAYSSHIDSHIYSYYAEILNHLYEEQLYDNAISNNVLAFRALGKSNINFAHEAFQEIKLRGNCSAVALDLSKFFDTLDHSILKNAWCSLLATNKLPKDHYAIFKAITKYSKVDKEDVYDLMGIPKNNTRHTKNTRKQICSFSEFRNKVRKSNLIVPNKSDFGIPQGSPISALLSNIYMLNFDIEMNKYVSLIGGKYFNLWISSFTHNGIQLNKKAVEAFMGEIAKRDSKVEYVAHVWFDKSTLSYMVEHGNSYLPKRISNTRKSLKPTC